MAASRCRVCYQELHDESTRWKDVFVCHLPPTWDGAFFTKMLNDVLGMAFSQDHRCVQNVFLAPRSSADELLHGYIHLSSHEPACFIVNDLGKSLFATCGAYVGAMLGDSMNGVQTKLLLESRDVVEQYVALTRSEHLERLSRTQRHVIDTLVAQAATAQKRIAGLEHALMQMQGKKYKRVLPRV